MLEMISNFIPPCVKYYDYFNNGSRSLVQINSYSSFYIVRESVIALLGLGLHNVWASQYRKLGPSQHWGWG